MVIYDISHFISKLYAPAIKGISAIDTMYFEYFAQTSQPTLLAHYSFGTPLIYKTHQLEEILSHSKNNLTYNKTSDENWREVVDFLRGDKRHKIPRIQINNKNKMQKFEHLLSQTKNISRLLLSKKERTPDEGIYLNIGQYGLEYALLFHWLKDNKKIKPVFFLHDLLPLDYPEFFPKCYNKKFHKRLQTIHTFAHAVITTSETNENRFKAEWPKEQIKDVTFFHLHPPSPLEGVMLNEQALQDISQFDYFLAIGTIEPRKNYLFLVDIWRHLIKTMQKPPKLICVGSPGWQNNATLRALSEDSSISSHVILINKIEYNKLALLIKGSKALLSPSFAEGFGLPLIEALSLETPVICADTEIYVETTQKCAHLIPLNDPIKWVKKIQDFTQIEQKSQFETHTKKDYFQKLDNFLGSL